PRCRLAQPGLVPERPGGPYTGAGHMPGVRQSGGGDDTVLVRGYHRAQRREPLDRLDQADGVILRLDVPRNEHPDARMVIPAYAQAPGRDQLGLLDDQHAARRQDMIKRLEYSAETGDHVRDRHGLPASISRSSRPASSVATRWTTAGS